MKSLTIKNLVDVELIEQAELKKNNSRTSPRLPHPIPYQGSKRNLAPKILQVLGDKKFHRFLEPFAGSAAMTIAAANAQLAKEYIIGDALAPLIAIWQQILASPHDLATTYEDIWNGQLVNNEDYYHRIRDEFNLTQEPALLLYLLARCVKNALRFNQRGQFNQSHDKRRLGMHPDKMYKEIQDAHLLLANHTTAICGDFAQTIASATEQDLIYMDPPYEGTTTGTDKRYYQGLDRERLITILNDLQDRNVPFILSYDGRCGDKVYGEPLPSSLNLRCIELVAGRSSQSTLSGRAEVTVESLYVSRNLTHD